MKRNNTSALHYGTHLKKKIIWLRSDIISEIQTINLNEKMKKCYLNSKKKNLDLKLIIQKEKEMILTYFWLI